MRRYVLGVDEAGRGPLAGPVAVGVVMAEESFDFLTAFPELNDSKKISEKKREKIFEQLLVLQKTGAVRFCVKSVSASVIDKSGIAKAVRVSVYAGIRELAPAPEGVRVYLDGSLHAPEEYGQETVVGGDALIPAIMLASVAAKVSRDRFMVKLAGGYPGYGFEQHKGYGTKAHIEAIQRLGFSDLHRRSFCKNIGN
jgi:ribonuclease HII